MTGDRTTGLTLEDRTRLLSGGGFWTTAALPAAGVEPLVLTDGPHGVRRQRKEADHLGINDSAPATAFPTASCTGSTWDATLLERMGAALGAESRALGVDVLLGPGVNIKRSPLCGRNFEYFSEDPLLSGVLGAAWVRGVQSRGVGASVKHFAANNQETDRQRIDVVVDERTLREIYLRAFEIVVREAEPMTVMCSYNRVNGEFASQNRWLLTEVLRKGWGFDGLVVSDWGAVVDPVAAVAAGLDLEMPTSRGRGPAAIAAAVRDGRLDEGAVDIAISRVLTLHDRLAATRTPPAEVDQEAHHALGRELACAGSVLLSNDRGLLPLSPDTGAALAVIGEFARTPRYQGGGSSHIVPTRLDDALGAIRRRASRPVRFAPGFALQQHSSEDAEQLLSEAVAVARDAEVTVLFLGLPPVAESEGYDRTDIDLPAPQRALLDAVLDVTTDVVVVLSNGGVVSMDGIAGRVPAVLETWLAGQAGGSAVSDMLFGDAEPGGRLAESIPLRLQDTPSFVNWPGSQGSVLYGERHYVGYRWYDATQSEVAYPFGHGLGYTSFELADVEVAADADGGRVEVTVRNIGRRSGSEVVQVYVGDLEASVDRAPRELAGFAKVHLPPGASERVSIDFPRRAWQFWGRDGWTAESGEFEIGVGTSSRNLPFRTIITVEMPDHVSDLDEHSTLGEWVAHPVGRAVLEAALPGLHPQAVNLTSGETLRLSASIPLRSLAGMSGAPDPAAFVAGLLAEVAEREAVPVEQ